MKARIANLISCYSFEQVERMLYSGQIGQATFEAYCEVWTWIAPRFSSVCQADRKQESFWKRHGKDRFYTRINRVRAAFGFAPIG